MKINLTAAEKYCGAMGELSNCFGFEICESGVPVVLKKSKRFAISYTKGAFSVTVEKDVQAGFALKYISDTFSDALPEEGFNRVFSASFDELTYMLDCSRNAVPKNETVFELIRHLAVLGYDCLGLYMEDTFVVKNQPYFGYLRTPFTREDIAEIDGYCKKFGIELVPYIQTLAHFNTLQRHYAMADLFEVNDILLVGEERTYAFIEDLISTCSQYFSSRHIHIGMDEAYMLGRGKYTDLHGAHTRFEIMQRHLERVTAICKKYQLLPAMWSDMFFSLSLSGQYGEELPKEITDCVPPEVELIYWDYCDTHEEHYAELIKKHRCFNNELGFAAGAWKWLGFTPDNRYSFASCEASARACIENGVKKYIVTGWGDNGAECSVFASLPALHHCGRFNYGDFALDEAFRQSFSTLSGMDFSEFMTIDLCNRVTDHDDVEEKNSANKYLLFNDILLGTLDTTVAAGTNELFASHTRSLRRAVRRGGKWKYLFETQLRLSRILEIKAELGVLLRQAYQRGDRQELARLMPSLKGLLPRIEAFYRAFRTQWDRENRPNGFDVQDIRIGALKQRVHTAIKKISDYLSGKSKTVDELGENLLDFMGHGNEFEKDFDQCEWRWRRMTSVNVNE